MATTITAASSLSDVLVAFNTRTTVTTTGWTAVPSPNTPVSGAWSATVGLFGDDLTSFFADCATVGYNECNPASFAAYSGWAVGIAVNYSTVMTAASND